MAYIVRKHGADGTRLYLKRVAWIMDYPEAIMVNDPRKAQVFPRLDEAKTAARRIRWFDYQVLNSLTLALVFAPPVGFVRHR